MFRRAYLLHSSLILISAICFLAVLVFFSSSTLASVVYLNEIHYDNTGSDSNEGVEIAGPSGTDLSGWKLLLYNGNGGVTYGSHDLSGIIPELSNGWGVLFFYTPGLQNGPDGLALVNNLDEVIQFLSYEGIFAATDGAAMGLLSELIGVAEDAATAVSHSIQLMGKGKYFNDFQWQDPQINSFGAINANQSISQTTASVPAPATLSMFVAGILALTAARRREVYLENG